VEVPRKVIDEDAIANYWKLSTTEEEATGGGDHM
jgi:hypothetical protein